MKKKCEKCDGIGFKYQAMRKRICLECEGRGVIFYRPTKDQVERLLQIVRGTNR